MDDKSPLISKLSIILIGVASAALVVTIYHCIAVGWCNRRRDLQNPQRPQFFLSEIAEITSSIDNSMVQLIPTHKYQKDMELVGEDGTCPVCLSEFEEGEDLRTLPECLHSFHVACIDMWLFSHPSCPMCRADATPSPQIFHGVTESSGAIEFEIHQEPPIMLQSGVVQARTL